MKRIDLVLSNDRHHAAMMRPLAQALAKEPNYRCRIVSLCEFRGLPSPRAAFNLPGVEFAQVVPFRFRKNTAGGQSANTTLRAGRSWVRRMSWELMLERPLAKIWDSKPGVVVLPNDSAFPYDGIVGQLRARSIPFVLVQEGIRFPIAGVSNEIPYGTGGAAAIAAWGATSAMYFREAGAPPERIYATGSPRFDTVAQTDWNAASERLKGEGDFGTRNLALLTNPIDDQGFCSTEEKYALIRRVFAELAPLFDDAGFRLIVKLHGRENAAAYERLKHDLPYAKQIRISDALPLYPLLALADAALIFASTVGLEALLFDVPLGVFEIPGHGYIYDYVSAGAACGLCWDAPLAPQVSALMSMRGQPQPAVRAYVAQNLAVRENATGEILRLIEQVMNYASDRKRTDKKRPLAAAPGAAGPFRYTSL